MAPPRIPPIQCLQAFETVARLRSVSAAAEELAVTPSAVSHRIRQLESQLGFKLFGRDFALSDQGQVYLPSVRQGLAALQKIPGSEGVRPAGVRLRLAVTPTFSRQILLPRLALFRHANPEVELIMQVAIPLANLKSEDADLEIRFGTGEYPGLESRRVLTDELTPVCSPDYLHEHGPLEGFDSVADIRRVHLIRSPLAPWSTWFEAHGLQLDEPRGGAQFNDLGLALDAAAAGFGVALMRMRLGASWLDSGRLLRLSPRAVPSGFHHYICWKPGTLERWECAAFVEWLVRALA